MIQSILSMLHQLPLMGVLAWLLGINLLTFAIYAYDKRAAKRGGWRIPESSLHLVMLAGGTIGAFTAQRVLRHKNRKQSFQVTFWVLVVLQVISLLVLFL
jgi:uncharacterized membrane protein YsdA (DUF1294 family)